jgi:hypothetical protein
MSLEDQQSDGIQKSGQRPRRDVIIADEKWYWDR